MNQLKLLCVLSMLLLLAACSNTENRMAAGGESTGYWNKSGGKIWKSGTGLCWRSSSWSDASYHPECGGTSPAPVEKEQTGYFWPDDQDRDGLIDAKDNCPFTPDAIRVDSNGCALDSDGDGVPDYLDQCKGTPAGTVVDTSGCAYIIVSLSSVHFAFDSAALTSEAKSILDGTVKAINSYSSASFSVEGHTDNTGTDDYNQSLSERRANSVMDYLYLKESLPPVLELLERVKVPLFLLTLQEKEEQIIDVLMC